MDDTERSANIWAEMVAERRRLDDVKRLLIELSEGNEQLPELSAKEYEEHIRCTMVLLAGAAWKVGRHDDAAAYLEEAQHPGNLRVRREGLIAIFQAAYHWWSGESPEQIKAGVDWVRGRLSTLPKPHEW